MPQHEPRDADPAHRARRRREVRRQRDVAEVADLVAGDDAERRARVEAEPAEPEDQRPEDGVRHVVAGDRVRAPVVAELADPRPEEQRAGKRGESALVVDDRRAGEVLHADREEPAARVPDPVRDDRVEDREEGAEDEVDPELRPLGHRAPDDRERDAGEDDLEQVAGRPGNRREERERRRADRQERVRRREEAARADEGVAVAERDPEADRPVDDRADAEDEHVLAGDVRRVLHAGQARLEEGEPGLHEHDEDRREDDPDGVDRDEEVGVLHATSTSPRASPVRLWRDVLDRSRPDDPVPGLMPRARRIRDRGDHGLCDRVLDDEREQCLRQEPRLEDAAAVLVRDAALASVPDRLDDGHAHVPGLGLDGVDHRLDPLADDYRFHFRHVITSLRRSRTTTSRQTPSSLPSRSCVPTMRNPHFTCSARLASFSGKIPVWIVQIPPARCLRSAARAGRVRRPALCASECT